MRYLAQSKSYEAAGERKIHSNVILPQSSGQLKSGIDMIVAIGNFTPSRIPRESRAARAMTRRS